MELAVSWAWGLVFGSLTALLAIPTLLLDERLQHLGEEGRYFLLVGAFILYPFGYWFAIEVIARFVRRLFWPTCASKTGI
ncbi:MAG: hypothetical protein MRY64_14470 [Hyphomonadaceae bacterium]|nr:hypothetical protein [Hyphomonadaceae bacterium]